MDGLLLVESWNSYVSSVQSGELPEIKRQHLRKLVDAVVQFLPHSTNEICQYVDVRRLQLVLSQELIKDVEIINSSQQNADNTSTSLKDYLLCGAGSNILLLLAAIGVQGVLNGTSLARILISLLGQSLVYINEDQQSAYQAEKLQLTSMEKFTYGGLSMNKKTRLVQPDTRQHDTMRRSLDESLSHGSDDDVSTSRRHSVHHRRHHGMTLVKQDAGMSEEGLCSIRRSSVDIVEDVNDFMTSIVNMQPCGLMEKSRSSENRQSFDKTFNEALRNRKTDSACNCETGDLSRVSTDALIGQLVSKSTEVSNSYACSQMYSNSAGLIQCHIPSSTSSIKLNSTTTDDASEGRSERQITLSGLHLFVLLESILFDVCSAEMLNIDCSRSVCYCTLNELKCLLGDSLIRLNCGRTLTVISQLVLRLLFFIAVRTSIAYQIHLPLITKTFVGALNLIRDYQPVSYYSQLSLIKSCDGGSLIRCSLCLLQVSRECF